MQAYRVTLDAACAGLSPQLILLEEGNDEPLATMRHRRPQVLLQTGAHRQWSQVWGPSVQLYCLRSRHNWGIGDFSDLGSWLRMRRLGGAHFVGLNPSTPSTRRTRRVPALSFYSPLPCRWLNVAYIDVEAVPNS